jgi:hypothetical protein
MKQLKSGDLVWSNEHKKQGIVTFVPRKAIMVHFEGELLSHDVPREILFVKGDRVDVKVSKFWQTGIEYTFIAPLVHNPNVKTKFTVREGHGIDYVYEIRHHKERRARAQYYHRQMGLCINAYKQPDLPMWDSDKEQLLNKIRLLEIETKQKEIEALLKEVSCT